MNTSSIRFRLTAWYTVALVAALAVFAVAARIAVRISMTQAVDHSLTARVDALKRYLEYCIDNVPPEDLAEELREFAMGAPEGNLLELRDAQGHELLSSPLTPAVDCAACGFREMNRAGRPYRVLSLELKVRGKTYRVLAAANLDGRVYMLHRFTLLLLFAIPPVLLVAALGGWFLSRRALRPVDEMTEAARSIGIDRMSARLAAPRTGDELQRLAETWNNMLDRLEHSVKRLSQFTADASHELRSPVAFIRTAAEIALRQERTTASYRETLRQIADESERMSRLIEDLLMLARADAASEPLQLAPVNLADVVDQVCRLEERQARAKDLAFDVRVPEGRIVIQGNDPAIRRLVHALVDNAIKYTPSGGRIEVSLDDRQGAVELSVRDSGIGIGPADLPHVFDRFYRADKARSRDEGGCGLGLSIAQWIARRHRAEILAESDAGRGSVFTIAFQR